MQVLEALVEKLKEEKCNVFTACLKQVDLLDVQYALFEGLVAVLVSVMKSPSKESG